MELGGRVPAVYAFGDFEVDKSRFELRHCGQRVSVQPKVLRLLLLLIEHRDRTVGSDELLSTLWPNETVSPASVKRAVRGARKAIGDEGESQASIRTVRGHGYRFMLDVSEPLSLPPRTPLLPPAGPPPPDTPRLREPGALDEPSESDDLFVGRKEALAVLGEEIHHALSGRGRTVLIVGEPGIGKTRILHELQTLAFAQDMDVWFGRCMEVEGAPAFWPLMQMLQRLAAECAPGELETLLGVGAADIAEAIPELRRWLPNLPEAPSIGSLPARFRFFDSMTGFLRRRAGQRPLALCFDDLQRADEPTLHFLLFLARQLEGARLLVVGTVRPGAHREPANYNLLAEIGKAPMASAIELTGLSRPELQRYLDARGVPAPSDVAELLHERTAGNPLFLEHLVRSMRLAGDAQEGEGAWARFSMTPLSHGVRGIIDRHLDMLSDECGSMLRIAAVLGREFSCSVLGELIGCTVDDVRARIMEPAIVGVVQEVPDALDRQRFTHALVRDALYAQLAPAERARLHGQAASIMEARGAATHDGLLPALTEHFILAAPHHDGGRALEYCMRSAMVATSRLAHEEAVRYYDRALQLIELLADDAGQRMKVLLGKAEAQADASFMLAARATALEAVRMARETGAVDALVRAAVLMGRVAESGQTDVEQVALLREALGALSVYDPRHALLQALLAKALSYARCIETSVSLAMQACTHARRLDDSGMRSRVLLACLEGLAPPDFLAERRSIVEELLRTAAERGDHAGLLRAWVGKVWNSVESGNMVEADAAIAALESLAEQLREPYFRWCGMVFRGMRALVQGRLEHAEALAHAALEFGSRYGSGNSLASHAHAVHIFSVYRLQGRAEQARALVREQCARYPALGGWRAELATLDAQFGDLQGARNVLDYLMADNLHVLRNDPFLLSAYAPAADLCALVGDKTSARALYEAILPYAAHHGNVSFGISTQGSMERPLANLALKMGEVEQAEQHALRALASAQAMDSPMMISLSRFSYGRILLKHGPARHALAAEQLRLAAQIAQAATMHGVAQHCQWLAERAGLTLP